MQSLSANKRKLYYALFVSSTDKVDSQGYKTGGKEKTYTEPVELWANVSAARGTAETEQFGINDNYDRTITTTDLTLPIQEDTILWIGIEPLDGQSHPVPHNYKVVRVARSVNSITYAIRKVSVS